MERNIDATPSLPKIHNPNKSRVLPLSNNGTAHIKKLTEKYNNPSTPLSTYQAEIASIPLLKHKGKNRTGCMVVYKSQFTVVARGVVMGW